MRNTFLLLCCLLMGTQVMAQKNPNLKQLDRYYEQVVEDWEIPGMTVGIVKDGKLIFAKGYGVKEAGGAEKPDANTLFAIASNSKAFTSTLIAMLVQEGKLNWDDKVVDYLPYFAIYDPALSQQVTIRDMLSHRVGLGTFSGDVIWYKSELPAQEIIKRIKYVPQAYDFRAGYGYSNLMYITAGELIKAVTGKSWAENVEERILQPLGMNRTIARLGKLEETGNYASPHALISGENVVIPWVNWDEVASTGGLISSVNDLANWLIFNLQHGIWKGDTLLTKDSRNMLWTPHNVFPVDHTSDNPTNTHFRGYGLGWALQDYHGRLRVSHTGGYDGFITAINLIPDENLGVIVLTNGVKSPIGAVSYYTMDHFLGENIGKDWSKEMLERTNAWREKDSRIAERKAKRVQNTTPGFSREQLVGTYHTKAYGNITVEEEKGELKLKFEHSPLLTATLRHWHFDTYEIVWDEPQAWFSFGTVQFTADNNREVKGIEFDVPNDDFFFEELNAEKVENPSASS